MNSGQNEAPTTKKEKVLEAQQRTQESGSENEETDSITDQSSQSKSTKSATQFSVQRSDTDGLRMKISAIRNPRTTTAAAKTTSSPNTVVNKVAATTEISAAESSRKRLAKGRKMSEAQETGGGGGSGEAMDKSREKDVLSTVNATKKIKVKRKKFAQKSCSNINNNNLNVNNNSKMKGASALFSSDSEDDLPLKLHVQRAPRLLLTAIGSGGGPGQADNMGITSSDNEELPDLVKEAIKRVESDTEDNSSVATGTTRTKQQLPQYQSTLLQDFMEKTQMLNHSGNAASLTHIAVQKNSNTENISSTNNIILQQQQPQQQPQQQQQQRKRRGRPKKVQSSVNPTGAVTAIVAAAAAVVPTINESGDSGVISTTPSPKMQQTVLNDNPKPKIDMAYLDKRMYATERVLYPPPRSKRRQSNKKTTKEELQLDPLWRKIDVNKKFRLRSVSGYKSDGGGGGTSTTVCSKVLAAKSGYVSDYGSVRHQRHNHNSGYKSDASGKSRYSSRSCTSRRMSRAKSCGYRSDCKESSGKSSKSLRRRRRASMLKSNHEQASNALSDEHDQDILQLAGLSLGQSSEESNEYISKPSLKCLPSTSASKKYGEINRFVATGQYFSGATKSMAGTASGATAAATADQFVQGKMLLQRKNSISQDTIVPSKSACKIKSRRSSAASMCSSYVSGVSRLRRRHRRKSFSHAKSLNVDSKLLTEIDIIASTFHTRCRIQDDRLTASSGKEKLLAEGNKLQATLTAPIPAAALPLLKDGNTNNTPSASSNVATKPVKRALKKRKLNEPLIDFAMLSASAGNSNNIANSASNISSNGVKRRHKKSSSNGNGGSNSSSPDDHKLPLKKRHYLVTTGAEVASAFASNGKMNAEAWAAAAAAAKSSANSKAQAQFNAKKLTPKKRHLLVSDEATSGGGSTTGSASPLRIIVDNNSISGGKLLDISPSSLCSLKQQRRQGGKSKASANIIAGVIARELPLQLQSPSGSSSCPPPGIFEPSVELEIQIPLTKLNEAVITKSEVESPLLSALDIKEDANKKEQCQRVLETLLHKTGGNLLLKRKRKKINRTGFPTVRRKKRKVSVEQPLIQQQDPQTSARETRSSNASQATPAAECERVPQPGEARETFVARSSNQRTPRLSVVALERLQRPPTPANSAGSMRGRPRGRGRPRLQREPIQQQEVPLIEVPPVPKKRGRAAKQLDEVPPKLERKLETSIKLPAGIDPNTNFSCQIRLKRRKNMQHNTDASQQQQQKKGLVPLLKESSPQTSADHSEIEAEAAAKFSREPVPRNEHDPLPVQECIEAHATDYASCSDTSEDKCSTTSQRKRSKLKKTYLVAGLFSNHYKQHQVIAASATTVSNRKLSHMEQKLQGSSLLPPPVYCERYFRGAQSDFELPYDIWWAYSHDKLQRHSVPSWNYRKIRTNVYAESVRPNLAGFDHPNCNCKPQASGACLDNCLNRMVYTECAPINCPAGDKCRNQKIQRHEVAPGVERFMTVDKGWGVRTKLPIAKGTYILEYVGEVVTEREFKQRMATIYLNDTHHYCLHLDGGLVIDGQRMGSDCRFVNHSCEPNCEMQKWSVNGLSRMVLFAKRAIEQGEELTYDYNFSLFNPSEGQPCRCNMPQCRGVIGGKSQRIKPLPVDAKAAGESAPGSRDAISCRNGRQRKHKAKKNAQRQQQAGKDAEIVARVQQLSDKEKKLVKNCNIFLVRNFEKIRRCKAKKAAAKAKTIHSSGVGDPDSPGRRPSTPSSTLLLATQISALCTSRNMKTRGLTQAVQDPELEKMAKMAVVLRDIGTTMETLKMFDLLAMVSHNNKKKKQVKATRLDFKTIQAQVEQGHYKTPQEYDEQMQQLFAEARQQHGEDETKSKALQALMTSYEQLKISSYVQLVDILGSSESLEGFKPHEVLASNSGTAPTLERTEQKQNENIPPFAVESFNMACSQVPATDEEDVIRCICGLYKDEGLMIQCAKCMVWQHTECTKADINAENYQCERCEPREVDREIPLDDFTEEGHRYYLSLMRGELQVRQGDAVYVLRDIPIKDEAGNVVPSQKHTYETIGVIDYQECDIFRVEHLWKNDEGKRFIFGHHFLRPHETFHEPSRRFYPNEVVRVSLYEVVPIELVIGRCWVLDRTTFCKGRPMECVDEDHCFICELRVDKTARFFSKAKANYPACTKSYAFRKFPEKLKISKSYAPHDVDPSMLKTKKQKTDIDVATTPIKVGKHDVRTAQISGSRKQRTAQNGIASIEATVKVLTPATPNGQVLKKKRSRLENVLNTMKLKCLDAQSAQEQPIDLSYLLSGRGARQRKTNSINNVIVNSTSNSNSSSNSITSCA